MKGLGLDQAARAVLESFGLGDEFRNVTLPMRKEINRGNRCRQDSCRGCTGRRDEPAQVSSGRSLLVHLISFRV